MTVHPEGISQISTQLDIDSHHTLLRLLSDALDIYEAFNEPHLNSQQIDILEELTKHLDREID